MVNQVYYPYWKWEDYNEGVWRTVTAEEYLSYFKWAVEFTGDHTKYGIAMQRVIKEWPTTSLHHLTNAGINQKAWIGHAACCIENKCPEYIVRAAWGKLTTEQRTLANKAADSAISIWQKKIKQMAKIPIGINVLQASRLRIEWAFDNFSKIYLSFSGGKDSTAMLHLVAQEARKRGVRIGVLFIDWECQFELTIQHIRELFSLYSDCITVYWTQFEIMTNNATSMIEPIWKSWDAEKTNLWTRQKEKTGSIPDGRFFNFYFKNITFEEFISLFAEWYSDGLQTCCFVGIRAQESLNRFRAVSKDSKFTYDNKCYTTKATPSAWNVYPIYDWNVSDIWLFYYKTKLPYNEIYDRMHMAGLTPSQMRIDEPFGDEARKNLWLYHVIEPATWAKITARMNGVNCGALYSKENGNVLGNVKISLPDGHTWQSFSEHILATMPPKTAEHYKNKIAVYIKWYRERGYPDGIPDMADYKLEQLGKAPAWRQIAKTLLRNDYWCRNLGFSITKSSAYEKYMDLMKRRRKEWKIF